MTAASARAVALVLLLGTTGGAASPARAAGPELGRLRALYLASVEDAGAIEAGLEEVERLREATATERDPWLDGTLAAYRGALVTLRAKHAVWPVAKLRHLREGLAVLDGVVAAQPDHAEARYLRAMSCYYLPAFLGRGWSVREDLRALARLMPGERPRYPESLYVTIVRFLLEKGELSAAERRPLERALRDTDE